MARAAARRARGAKCELSPGWLIVGLILAAIGIWALAAGFIAQLNAAADMVAILAWYFVGVLLLTFAKWIKWKAHGACPMHGWGMKK